MSESKKGLEGFWKKRLLKVYIPYILAVIIFLLVTQAHLNIKEIVFGIILIKPINPFGWYLRYIFVCYIVFYVVFTLIKNNKQRQIAIFLIFATFFVIRSTIFIGSVPFLQARQMACFPIGILLANLKINRVKNFLGEQKKKAVLAFSVFLILMGTMIYGIEHTDFINIENTQLILFNFISLGTCTICALGIILLVYRVKLIQNKGLVRLSYISYEIYIVHGYTIGVIKNGKTPISILIFLLLTFIGTILLSFISNKVVSFFNKNRSGRTFYG